MILTTSSCCRDNKIEYKMPSQPTTKAVRTSGGTGEDYSPSGSMYMFIVVMFFILYWKFWS